MFDALKDVLPQAFGLLLFGGAVWLLDLIVRRLAR